jgi:DNA-directed RNA polymerase alpha subunit
MTDTNQEKEYTTLDWYLLGKCGAISTRMANCCRNAGIKTKVELAELVKTGKVLKLKQCGRKTIHEMEKFTGEICAEEQRRTEEEVNRQKQMLQRCVTILKRNGYEVIPPK